MYSLTGKYQQADKSHPMQELTDWLHYNAGPTQDVMDRTWGSASCSLYEFLNIVRDAAAHFGVNVPPRIKRVQRYYGKGWQVLLFIQSSSTLPRSYLVHAYVEIEDADIALICKLKFFSE